MEDLFAERPVDLQDLARFGLFSATSDHTLYPATSAFAKYRQAADLYTFLGKVVGKAPATQLQLSSGVMHLHRRYTRCSCWNRSSAGFS